MKITIAYTDEKRHEAGSIEAFIKGILPSVKVRKSNRHAPFYHTYITTTKPKNPCGSKENT